MKPVMQTETTPGKGNCLAACFASILEVPIEEIPDLDCGNNRRGLADYLAGKGMTPIWLRVAASPPGVTWAGHSPPLCVLIGPSPRLPGRNHAVVGRPDGWGYEIVHDPHPEGGGLSGPIEGLIYLGAKLP